MHDSFSVQHRRVVVTGIGSIAPCGIGKGALLAAMRGSRSFVRRITRFDASTFPSRIAAEVPNFDPAVCMDRRDAARLDRGTQYAIAAARESLEDAGLPPGHAERSRIGVSIGVAAGSMEFFEGHLFRSGHGETGVFHPHFYAGVAASASSAVVARMLGLHGLVTCISTGCTTGTDSVGYAFRQIRSGRADVMVAGGTDASISPLTFGSFTIVRAMSTRNDAPERASRPFDRGRDGFVMGEGAGVVVLEERDHALRRGARICMEVAGYGTTLNAYHMTAPRPDGSEMARAIRIALDDAAVRPEEIDYVSAHGSSTPLNEPAETKALKVAFGGHAHRLCVSSLKSMVGHTFGGAGGHQAVAAALTFVHDLIPPTVNLDEPDPACDLDCVPWTPRRMAIRAMLQNSCGFSGKNAALVYRRHEPAAEANAAA
jgi:3-oxoacyl-[acyl-carrier-protein] synthase II